MIYVSSHCSRKKSIIDVVVELAEHGFKNIELTGGTQYLPGFEEKLIRLKEKYKLNFLVHNYFPPPQKDFVINLASLEDEQYQASLHQLQTAIDCCNRLGVDRFGFHAGFFLDFQVAMLGQSIGRKKLNNKNASIQRFVDGYSKLKEYAGDQVALYVENNVYSKRNYSLYGQELPFMLLGIEDYKQLQKKIDCNLLLDVAHLYVTAHSLGRDIQHEFKEMLQCTDYIHISNNDGHEDQNKGLLESGSLYALLQRNDLKGKTITLEIYDGLDSVRRSQELIAVLI